MQTTKLCKNKVLSLIARRLACFIIIVGLLSLIGCANSPSSYIGRPSPFGSAILIMEFVNNI